MLFLLFVYINGNSITAEDITKNVFNTPETNSISTSQTTSNDRYVVKVGIVTDYEFYLLYGAESDGYIRKVMNNSFQPFYNTDIPIYFVLETIVVMSNQSWSESSFSVPVVGGEIEAGDLLSRFTIFSQNEEFLRDLDMIQLFTGRDFTGSQTGLAYLGSNPGSNALGVIQATSTEEVIGYTVTHEMGHNFGASHDGVGNTCPTSGYIMAPASGIPPATEFSSCSITSINDHLSTSWTSVIDSEPPFINPVPYETLELGALRPFWIIYSSYANYYNVFINGTLVKTDTWKFTTTISSKVINQTGHFNVSIEVFDLLNRRTTDWFEIEIVDSGEPLVYIIYKNQIIDSPITAVQGHPDNKFLLNVTDAGMGMLTLYMDGELVLEKEWNKRLWIEYDFTDLSLGDHLLVIDVFDMAENSIHKEIKITVLENNEFITSTTTKDMTSTTTNSDTESTTPSLLGGSVFFTLTSSFVLIIILRRKY